MSDGSAVVFDLDGTLVDSEPLSDDAWRLVLAEHGYLISEEELQAVHGLRFGDVYASFARRAPLPSPDELWSEYSQVLFASFDARLVPFADAVTTARRLQAEGVPLALATSSRRERLDRTLAAVDLTALFPVTVAGDEVSDGKPAPDSYLAAAELLGIDPAHCVAIEDSQAGIDAARAAGMKVLAVTRPGLRGALTEADLLTDEVSAAGVCGLLRERLELS
jgi:HAD superfamily hydrolase (TIGR01509 family)